MAPVIVRNLAEDVVSSQKLNAKLAGHSLEQALREILERAAELSKEAKLALTRSIRAKRKERPEDGSADLILEDRETRCCSWWLPRGQVVPGRAR